MPDIVKNIEQVLMRIRRAAQEIGRDPTAIKMVAVTKTVDAQLIRKAVAGGLDCFGENYVQEAREKIEKLADCYVFWHFIGHLQSNKARDVVDRVAYVHSVDRRSVMKQLNKRTDSTVDVLLQINIAEQDSKSGVSPEELED